MVPRRRGARGTQRIGLGVSLRGQVGQLTPLEDPIKSDTLSVLSFEVALFGWMALAQYVIWKAPIDSSRHWFLMQI
jgi:hypothetical protein